MHIFREPVLISSLLVGWLEGFGLKISELMRALFERKGFYNGLAVKTMSSQL